MRRLRVVTYNIHKGFSHFTRRLVLDEIRDRLEDLEADVAFLQEVVGRHERHARRHEAWPAHGQHLFLCRDGAHHAYGMNAVYQHGHHGNAIVSRFPIPDWENLDISHHRLERRGLLHCRIDLPGWTEPLHAINVHLGLWGRSRRTQLHRICERIRESVPRGAPLVVAGDFNDWRSHASAVLRAELGLVEAFEHKEGSPARTYPALLPVLPLDRIYVSGLEVGDVERHAGGRWSGLSDHLALAATLRRS